MYNNKFLEKDSEKGWSELPAGGCEDLEITSGPHLDWSIELFPKDDRADEAPRTAGLFCGSDIA
jgi:hypothetical protein